MLSSVVRWFVFRWPSHLTLHITSLRFLARTLRRQPRLSKWRKNQRPKKLPRRYATVPETSPACPTSPRDPGSTRGKYCRQALAIPFLVRQPMAPTIVDYSLCHHRRHARIVEVEELLCVHLRTVSPAQLPTVQFYSQLLSAPNTVTSIKRFTAHSQSHRNAT